MRVFVCLALLITIVTIVQGQGYGRTRRPPTSPTNVCRYGNDGYCLGFLNQPCTAPDTTCTHAGGSLGLCCRNRPVQQCSGYCGSFVGSCQLGYECIRQPGSRYGTCCKSSHNAGRCPPQTVHVFTCRFTNGINYCLSDKDCSGGKICCTEGCNRVCKHPMMIPF